MRTLLVALACLLALLQYRLWFADGSLAERARLRHQVQAAQQENASLQARNETLTREVRDLRSGEAVLEQRAREELNLVRDGEVFYQFIEGGGAGPQGGPQ